MTASGIVETVVALELKSRSSERRTGYMYGLAMVLLPALGIKIAQ